MVDKRASQTQLIYDTTATSDTSDIWLPNRKFRETAIFQAEVEAGGTFNAFVIQGQLTDDPKWWTIHSFTTADFSTSVNNTIAVVLDLYPRIRVAHQVSNGKRMRVWMAT